MFFEYIDTTQTHTQAVLYTHKSHFIHTHTKAVFE